MKSYTDIEQSKKLAEILPKESADMKWYFWKSEIDAPKLPTFGYSKTAAESYREYTEVIYLACWSLTALLNVIPIEHNLHDYLTENGMVYRVETLYAGSSKSYDNPVDACYEMIIKLHELDLL